MTMEDFHKLGEIAFGDSSAELTDSSDDAVSRTLSSTMRGGSYPGVGAMSMTNMCSWPEMSTL